MLYDSLFVRFDAGEVAEAPSFDRSVGLWCQWTVSTGKTLLLIDMSLSRLWKSIAVSFDL